MVLADEFPSFPIMECQVCGEYFDVPRKWVKVMEMGNQILIDWTAADDLMTFHNRDHLDSLVAETEEFLRASSH